MSGFNGVPPPNDPVESVRRAQLLAQQQAQQLQQMGQHHQRTMSRVAMQAEQAKGWQQIQQLIANNMK